MPSGGCTLDGDAKGLLARLAGTISTAFNLVVTERGNLRYGYQPTTIGRYP